MQNVPFSNEKNTLNNGAINMRVNTISYRVQKIESIKQQRAKIKWHFSPNAEVVI